VSLVDEADDWRARVDRLAAEVAQTMRFYDDSLGEHLLRPDTAIQLAGSQLAGRDAQMHLREMLDRPSQPVASPIPAPDDLPVMAFATNIGLALKKA
jgi:hypothetical protein